MVAGQESHPLDNIHLQLETILDELRSATVLARQLASSVDDTDFPRRPAEGSWSIAECLEHLSITTNAYLPLLDSALEHPPAGQVPSPHRYQKDWMGWLLLWSMEPPSRMKSNTPASFEPNVRNSRTEVIGKFVRLQDELASRVKRPSGLRLEALRIASPFNKQVKYNLHSALCLLLAHQRRHLWQAQQVIIQLRGQ